MDDGQREKVRRSSLFQNVKPEGMERVYALGVLRLVEEGGFFFMQGDAAKHAYVLLNGRVKMIQNTPNGQQITLRMVPLINIGPLTARSLDRSCGYGWGTPWKYI